MSIYDLEFLERQEFVYKVYGENLVTKESVYNAWTFLREEKRSYICNDTLNLKLEYCSWMRDTTLRQSIKNEIYKNIPSCFENKKFFTKETMNITINKFLKFIGLSFKFIWTSLKKRVLDQFETSFGKDVLNLRLWDVASMLDFLNQEHAIDLNNLSIKKKAMYVSLYRSRHISDDPDYLDEYFSLLEQHVVIDKYSKTRLFQRIGYVFCSFHYISTLLKLKELNLLTEAIDLLLSMPEKEFKSFRTDYIYFYKKLASAKLVCGQYYFCGNLKVINKEKEKEFFANTISATQPSVGAFSFKNSPTPGWFNLYPALPLESYEEEKENFLHIYLLYKDAECNLDDYILDNFPVCKALIKFLGEEEAIKFLNKQKSF